MPISPTAVNPYVIAPEYIIGTNNIVVFVNGKLTWNFEEVAGTAGSIVSNVVKINDPITTLDKIVVVRRPGILQSPEKINATHYRVPEYDQIIQELILHTTASQVYDGDKDMCEQNGYVYYNGACYDTRDGAYVKMYSLNPAKTKLSPGKIIDFKSEVVLHDVPVWDPARHHHSPLPSKDVDFQIPGDIAQYSYALDGNINADGDYWLNNHIDQIWFDTYDLAYVPYYDDQMFNTEDRIKYWAALTDWASVDVYQWTKSSVPPADYATLVASQATDTSIDSNDKASGTPLKELYKKRREYVDFSINVAAYASAQIVMDTSITGALGSSNETQLTVADYDFDLTINTTTYTIVVNGRIGSTYQGLVDTINEDLRNTTVTAEIVENGIQFTTEDETVEHIEVNQGVENDLLSAITTTEVLQYTYTYVATNQISITADLTGKVEIGSVVSIVGSSNNDGSYEVDTVSYGPITTITFVENLPSVVDDGNVEITNYVSTFDSTTFDVRVDSEITAQIDPCEPTDLIMIPFTAGREVLLTTADTLPAELATETTYTLQPKLSAWVLHDLDGNEIRVTDEGVGLHRLVAKDFPTDWVRDKNLYTSFVAGVDGDLIPYTGATIQDECLATINGSWVAGMCSIPSSLLDVKGQNPEIEICETVKVYVNGIYITDAELDENGKLDINQVPELAYMTTLEGVAYKFTDTHIGKTFTIIREKDHPTTEQLAFDPTIKDDGTNLVQYKEDYPYVQYQYEDSSNNLKSEYFFWATNKNTRASGKTHSVVELKAEIENIGRPYMFYQNLLEGSTRDINIVGNIPVADPGGPYSAGLGQTIFFNGAGSVSPSGDVNDLTFYWDFGDGVSGSGITPFHLYNNIGTYTVTLSVEYNGELSAEVSTTATITYPEPVAEANGPYTVDINQQLSPSSLGSQSFSGNPLTYDWNWGDNSAHGTGASAKHTYTVAGLYTITLVVNDGIQDSVPDTAVVSVEYGDPVANAGGPYSVQVNSPLVFAGSGTDPNGLPLTYQWDFGDGNVNNNGGPTPTHIYTTLGTKNVSLVVTNGQTTSVASNTTVTVTAPPPPVAIIGGSDPIDALPGANVAFDGSASYDPSNLPITYAWDFDVSNPGVELSTLQNPSHTYSSTGTYYAQLIVSNGYSNSTAAVREVRLSVKPIADPGGPYTIEEGQPLTMDGSASTNPSGIGTLTYIWDFGDGYNGSGQSPVHTWASTGMYVLSLVVFNGVHYSDPVTTTVTVETPSVQNPGGGSAGAVISMSDDGTRLVIGQFNDSTISTNTGKVEQYDYVGGYWTLINTLYPPVPSVAQQYGKHIVLSGDGLTMVVSDYWSVIYVYTYSGGTWSLQQSFTPSGLTWNPTVDMMDLSNNGDVLAIGSTASNKKVFMYKRTGGTWAIQQIITHATDYIGYDVSLNSAGNVLVLPSYLDVTAHVYTESGGTWTLTQTITTPSSAQGIRAVALSGDGNVMLLAAPDDATYGTSAGLIWCYVYSGGSYVYDSTIPPPMPSPYRFGQSIHLSYAGDVAIMCSNYVPVLYSKSGTTWTPYIQDNAGPVAHNNADIAKDSIATGDVIACVAPNTSGSPVTYNYNWGSGGGPAGGYQVFAFNTPVSGTDPVGIPFSFGLGYNCVVDGGINHFIFVNVTGTETFNDLLPLLLAPDGSTASIDGDGNLRWTSPTTGPTSTISLSDSGFFSTLNTYHPGSLQTAVPGTSDVENAFLKTLDAVPMLAPMDIGTTEIGPTETTILTAADVAYFLPDRYTQAVVRGLGNSVREDDRLKMRFTQDFTLRDNYLDTDNSLPYKIRHGEAQTLELKDKHSEWVLFREKQSGNVPEVLWNKMVEAIVGFKLAELQQGTLIPVPTPDRVLYDEQHGTQTQYGLGDGQAFVKQSAAKSTILGLLTDPAFDTYPVDKEWFLSNYNLDIPLDAVAMMEYIYAHFSSRQVNRIFFEVFYDALADKHEYPDIFKTSLIALQNIRLLETEEVIKGE